MTVSELRGRLTYAEYLDWQLYAEEMGPLNSTVRVEWSIARAVAPFLKNSKPRDLAPWPREQEQEATLDDVAMLLTGVAKMGKKNV